MILIFTKGEGDGIVSWLTFKIFSTLPSKTTSVDLKQSYKKSCSNLFWRRVIIFKHYSFLSLKKGGRVFVASKNNLALVEIKNYARHHNHLLKTNHSSYCTIVFKTCLNLFITCHNWYQLWYHFFKTSFFFSTHNIMDWF